MDSGNVSNRFEQIGAIRLNPILVKANNQLSLMSFTSFRIYRIGLLIARGSNSKEVFVSISSAMAILIVLAMIRNDNRRQSNHNTYNHKHTLTATQLEYYNACV